MVSSRLLSQKDYAEARGWSKQYVNQLVRKSGCHGKASRKGWSKQYVNQLVRKGRIQLIDGKIDPAAADEALRRNRDPARQTAFRTDGMLIDTSAGRTDDPVASRMQGSFAKARTVREHYRAMREKLEFELAAGNLVERREVELEQFTLARLTRDRILQCGDGLAAKIAAALGGKERKVRDLVEVSLHNLVRDIENEISQRIQQESAAADERDADADDPD